MVNGNGTRPGNKESEEVFNIALKRHEVLFLLEALNSHRRLIKYCMIRIADIDFVEGKLLEERLDEKSQKYYYNLDLYIRELNIDLDKLLYPHHH